MSDELPTWPGSGLSAGPAVRALAVTPSDTLDLPVFARALYVGATGDVVINSYGGDNSITFAAVPAGTVLPVAVKRVLSTGTTASSIVALA